MPMAPRFEPYEVLLSTRSLEQRLGLLAPDEGVLRRRQHQNRRAQPADAIDRPHVRRAIAKAQRHLRQHQVRLDAAERKARRGGVAQRREQLLQDICVDTAVLRREDQRRRAQRQADRTHRPIRKAFLQRRHDSCHVRRFGIAEAHRLAAAFAMAGQIE